MTRPARLGVLGAVLVLLVSAPLRAQTSLSHPVTPPPPGPGFYTGYNFHMDADSIDASSSDPAFDWDADFGGDLDLIDYGAGRLNFLANYQVVLGNQLRVFDPNQGIYTLEFSSSVFVGHTEIAGVFHHISRHLSDRTKLFAIAWNLAGVRASRAMNHGRWHSTAQGTIGKVVEHAFVDYRWEAEGEADVRYDVNRHIAAIGGGSLTSMSVDHAMFGRSRQTGAHAEGGVRFTGDKGAIELFVAYDRRIDADPIALQTRTFALMGFRLLSR
jgi:hypothetical protein